MDWRNVKKFVVGEPYDAEVEYLESNGTQTLPIPNLYPTPNAIDVQVTGGASQTIAAVGAAGRIRKVWTNANGEYAVFGTSSGDNSFGISGSLRKTIEISLPRRASPAITATIDGVTKTGRVSGSSSVNGINVFGTSVFGFGTLRLYGVDHYKLVRVGQVGCLYDPETGAFIYPSTGTLACGPDVRVINRQEVIKISSGSTVLWKKPVPYDSEVEYLESTGTQYIETGLYLQSSDTVSMRASCSTDVTQCLWSARQIPYPRNTFTLFRIGQSSPPQGRFDYGINNSGDTGVNTPFDFSGWSGIHEYKAVANKFYIDDVLYVTGRTEQFTTAGTTRILASESASTLGTITNYFYGKVYGFKVVRDGKVVMDLHPVRVGTTGYLFDRISWTLFGNAGTGNFGYGADIN